ncbi:hypothetical protein CYMTET_23954, partial [Cymbomonas tetramitiformis]
MQLDLGILAVSNRYKWSSGDGRPVSPVHAIELRLADLNFTLIAEGRPGVDLVHRFEDARIAVIWPMSDPLPTSPDLHVVVELGVLDLDLTSKQYGLLTTCATTNVFEETEPRPPLFSRTDPPEAAREAPSMAAAGEGTTAGGSIGGDAEGGAGSGAGDKDKVWMVLAVSMQRAKLSLCQEEGRRCLAVLQVSKLELGQTSMCSGQRHLRLCVTSIDLYDHRAGVSDDERCILSSNLADVGAFSNDYLTMLHLDYIVNAVHSEVRRYSLSSRSHQRLRASLAHKHSAAPSPSSDLLDGHLDLRLDHARLFSWALACLPPVAFADPGPFPAIELYSSVVRGLSYLFVNQFSAAQPRTTLSWKRKIGIRVQRPFLNFRADFVLSVIRFFVPTFAGGAAEASAQVLPRDINFTDGKYLAEADVTLESSTRLLADVDACDDVFVYDGQGHKLYLPVISASSTPTPLILIGPYK